MRVLTAASTLLFATVAVGDPVAQTLTVPRGGDLQAALNQARPGATILLERGATYVGNFVLPAGPGGGDDRAITLRTAGDEGLPPAGGRIGPDASALLAKLQSPNSTPALATSPTTRGWRIELLEFLPNRNGAGDIIALGDGSTAQKTLAQVPSNLTLDRLYIHGDPDKGQKRAISLNAASVTITGSYISDIKAIGQDSQAIGGWNGPGDYDIENNYLEAAGENVMFGGSDPAILELTPTKITVRNNILSKPLAWRDPGQPQWQVKNIFELKNARGVLVEHNVLEHCWLQAQTGYAVLFTVRNQDGGCPWCQVEDVQFRDNIVRDVAAGIQILGTDPNATSRQTNRIVVRDNLFDGIDRAAWGGDGYFLLLSDAPRDVTIDHNTIVQGQSGGLIKIAHGVTNGLTFTNNVAAHGDYGIIGTNHGIGIDSINTFLPGAAVTRNVMAGGRAAVYPPGNLFPTVDDFKKQFVNFAGRDYRLVPGSAWRNAGTDGKDLGADMTAIAGLQNAMIAERKGRKF
ncbi:MAG TPA: hypothetical protein VFA27_01320 [Vicinamibacterales bacterium]|nr:hypothetical protein [Vicinamibacterales bacterium]